MHPKLKTYYFTSQKWPKEWIADAFHLARTAWSRVNEMHPAEPAPAPADSNPTPTVVSAAKSTEGISFNMEIDYGSGDGVVEEDEDAFERYLCEPPRRDVQDPIAYWHQQKEANLNARLAQFALNHLTAPGESVYSSACYQILIGFQWYLQISNVYFHLLVKRSLNYGTSCRNRALNLRFSLGSGARLTQCWWQ